MPVVAAVDRSERAASVTSAAAQLAADADLSLHVVHVGEVDVPPESSDFDPDRQETVSRERARATARELGRQAGLEDFEPVGLTGDPGDALLAYCEAEDADYVVVSARERSAVDQALFGSVTQSLLLQGNRPVLAVPHDSA